MLQHPWAELQVLIKEKWFTQKAFSSILWKKVSEVNELLKWKRNITIQRDYLLHQHLWTPIKYWILKQIDYDYSFLDIDESEKSSFNKEDYKQNKPEEISHHDVILSDNEDSKNINKPSWELVEHIEWEIKESNMQDSSLNSPEWQKELKNEIDKDLQNRANIFRSF